MSMNMMMRPLLNKSFRPIGRRGMSGGFLKKNLWIEENAGIRENTYKTWLITALLVYIQKELNLKTGSNLMTFLFVPFTLLYFFFKEDMTDRNRQAGKNNTFGANPWSED